MKNIFDFLVANTALITAWTAVAALFVSLLSIVLTSLNLWMQRTHNRKTVLPIGHITVGDYEDDIFVRLRNDGVGPLIVEKVIVFQINKENDPKTAIIDFMPELPGGYAWATFVRDISGRALSPDGQITLLELMGKPTYEDFDAARVIVRRELSKLCVQIYCRNIYNDRMPIVRRTLDWFARSK